MLHAYWAVAAHGCVGASDLALAMELNRMLHALGRGSVAHLGARRGCLPPIHLSPFRRLLRHCLPRKGVPIDCGLAGFGVLRDVLVDLGTAACAVPTCSKLGAPLQSVGTSMVLAGEGL